MMTSKRSIVTAVALASAAAGTAVVLALPGSASAGVPASGTFTVQAHPGTEADLDLGRSGRSAGDEGLFTAGLTRNGNHVGTMAGTCQTVRAGAHADVQLCEFDLRFGTSQLTTRGLVVAGLRGPGTFTLPIDGGTGRYDGASGQVAFTATNHSTLPIKVQLTS
jgi:hypothetical protein